MPNDIEVRHLRPSDIDDVRRLLELCRLPTADVAPDMLKRFVGAFAHRRLIAVGGLERLGDVALLRSVAVEPTIRGNGHASRLIATLEADALRLGTDVLYLLTDGAQSYFARHGYAEVDRGQAPPRVAASSQFTSLCGDHAVLMRKRLSPLAPGTI